MKGNVISIYTSNPKNYTIGTGNFVKNKNRMSCSYCKIIDIVENTEKIGTERDNFTHVVLFEKLEA